MIDRIRASYAIHMYIYQHAIAAGNGGVLDLPSCTYRCPYTLDAP